MLSGIQEPDISRISSGLVFGWTDILWIYIELISCGHPLSFDLGYPLLSCIWWIFENLCFWDLISSEYLVCCELGLIFEGYQVYCDIWTWYLVNMPYLVILQGRRLSRIPGEAVGPSRALMVCEGVKLKEKGVGYSRLTLRDGFWWK